MEPDTQKKSVKVSQEDFNVISNRIAVALAQREAIIKSWTASSSRAHEPAKTEEELDAEDAILFRAQPQYLGVGAPLPAEYLVPDAERNTKILRSKFFPGKGLKASKARDAEEKAASAKRGLKHESSDEEEGRSGLGRSKKRKVKERLEDDKARRTVENNEEEGDVPKLSTSKSQKKPASLFTATSKESESEEEARYISKKKQQKIEKIEKGNADIASKIEARLNALLREKGENKDSSGAEEGPAGPLKESVLDPAERKKMKKREKKKRAKLKAAALASKI